MKLINSPLVLFSVTAIPSSIAQGFRGQRGNSNGQRGGILGGRGMGMGRGMGGGSPIDPDLLVDSTCADACGLMGDDIGVLVCRTIGDRTFSTCIDTEEGLASDVCGCCEDECPTACTTSDCGVTGGVLVEKARRNGDVRSKCVSPLDSVTMLLRNNTVCG